MILCARPNPQLDFNTSLRIYKSIGFKHIRFDINNIPKSQKDKRLDIFNQYHASVKEAGMIFGEFHCFSAVDIDFGTATGNIHSL